MLYTSWRNEETRLALENSLPKPKEDLKIINILCDNAKDAANDQNHRKILANVLCTGPNDDDDDDRCNGARGSNTV